ncbi:nucleotidyltransferase family protein [Shewanella sp. TC10]|uniref:nucleotidyltransferase family protein n=1 Tax=Shewanella sp. TC10 TaxID=1419739 RepID=UPI00129EC35B|nr:nucleotidyltransferase family protein [Shewanella sp. TC10]
MEYEAQLKDWLLSDEMRMSALKLTAQFFAENEVDDWYIAAGFVRNLVWDKLHDSPASVLEDIDVIYWCHEETSIYRDKLIELALSEQSNLPWSVKNQARMHKKNNHSAYSSCLDAMSYWPEKQTAIAVKLDEEGELIIDSVFGLETVFSLTVNYNPKADESVFMKRVSSKPWFNNYPKLSLEL